MPQLKLSQNAVANLAELDLSAAALDKLSKAFDLVCVFPNAGQLSERAKEQGENMREKSVRVGKRGYSFLYYHNQNHDEIVVLAVKASRQNIFNILD
ncbi:Uncharacterised protein [Moraxella ovis]|uniref:Plasmid stabilisation system protein n=1 Tax=Moraxella ovis TaxID=29433 RepID=A0A378QCI6_9GAMM|nr:type II toxin-antitoxin system RelE/ParE family toxin [Moraxella ovis]STY98617.1 Uncharacterised protein [Moraxella ovis]